MEHTFKPQRPGVGIPLQAPNPNEEPIPLPDKQQPEFGDVKDDEIVRRGSKQADEDARDYDREKEW